ncbi:hypothetical protein AB0L65_62315, partial [Nonomuraea sp. NPDC052116]|uniref:hypothetical protein n=1 Tax=Nonomuraea sp. NPDC052116 TaxID=3155665 RepID=UPI003429D891
MFADEVADLDNSAATLVGHWKLDEESGTPSAPGRASRWPPGSSSTTCPPPTWPSRAAGFQFGFDKEQQRWTLGMRAADTDTAALVRTRSDAI